MSDYLFPPSPPASVAVAGSTQRFPVRRIYCAGQNYVAHALEMGGDPSKQELFFFDKPADAVVADGARLPMPPATDHLSPEIELAVAIGEGGSGSAIAKETALAHVFGYAAAFDLTRRDMQARLKKMGVAYDLAKAFDRSCPVGAIRPAAEIGHPRKGRIWLAVNGEVRQDSNIDDLIYDVPTIIAGLSAMVELKPGDLILTGTPAGVSRVVKGDRVEGGIEGVGTVTITVL
ncbi:MAG: fumarylacetoacetate hydrolase family protein [Proteobacteria bacterium]|nr:fumarylacetoacetate hydrolase family protein [Pseudomonadota bacterium]